MVWRRRERRESESRIHHLMRRGFVLRENLFLHTYLLASAASKACRLVGYDLSGLAEWVSRGLRPEASRA